MTEHDAREDSHDAALAAHLGASAGSLLQHFRASFTPPVGADARAAAAALRDAADAASQEFLGTALAEARPDDAVLSEEAADSAARDAADRVWIIDPLDGTWEYGLGRADWAVHVALWRRDAGAGALALGVVAVPDEDQVYTSAEPPVLPELDTSRPLRIIASRSRPPAALEQIADQLRGAWSDLGGPAEVEIVQVGSVGAKVARLLAGSAEAYVHDTGFYEWDVAAPLAVARAAGLHASHTDGRDVTFNHRPPYVTDLVVCRREVAPALLAALAGAGRP